MEFRIRAMEEKPRAKLVTMARTPLVGTLYSTFQNVTTGRSKNFARLDVVSPMSDSSVCHLCFPLFRSFCIYYIIKPLVCQWVFEKFLNYFPLFRGERGEMV